MMTVSGYLGCLILAIVSLRFLYQLLRNDGLPLNWPLVGMHPVLLLNFHRIHYKLAEFLQRSKGTFLYKGVWFANQDYLMTSYPENVHHILSKDNSVYVKGSEWRDQFDIFGEALFNSDGDAWRWQRKTIHSFLNHKQFQHVITKLIPDRVEQGLVKVLDQVSERGLVVDLQDLLIRHSFDLAFVIATGTHSRLLSVEFPENRFQSALSDALEAAFYRFVLPDTLWKLQRWLQIGKEKRVSNAWKALDDLSADYIAIQREKCSKAAMESNELLADGFEDFNLVKCYLTGHEVITGPPRSDSQIRDNLIGFMLAMGDSNSTTLAWFFYVLSKNPSVQTKIREELKSNLSFKQVGKSQLPSCLNTEQNKLVYLHAALCEALRLFPPIPFETRTSTERDILPSGHCVNQKMNILINMYAMGRMTWIWGEDCHEFKPERWITEEGKLKREPPSKFSAFLAGPRICPGKELGFTLMKATAATIIHNYDVHVLQGQNVTPKHSVILHMKHGLKVRVKNRFP